MTINLRVSIQLATFCQLFALFGLFVNVFGFKTLWTLIFHFGKPAQDRDENWKLFLHRPTVDSTVLNALDPKAL